MFCSFINLFKSGLIEVEQVGEEANIDFSSIAYRLGSPYPIFIEKCNMISR